MVHICHRTCSFVRKLCIYSENNVASNNTDMYTDHGYGTIWPLNCDSKTFASPSLGGYLRQFCFAETRRFVTSLFNGAGYKHSYLLTYLLMSSVSISSTSCTLIVLQHQFSGGCCHSV